MNVERYVALQYHVVSVERRHAQSVVIARDAAVDGLGKDAGAFGVGMDGVGEEVGVGIERFVEVDEFGSAYTRHGFDGSLNFVVPLLRTRLEARMAVCDGRHASQYEAHLGVGGTQRVHNGEIVLHKLVAIVGPVAWVGVVDAEMNDGDVALEAQRLLKFRLLHVGTMTLIEKRGARLSEVTHHISVTQHLLQLNGIREVFAVGDACAVSDAVTYASHTHRLCSAFLALGCSWELEGGEAE